MLPLNFQNMLNVQINVNKSFANIKPVNSRSWKPYTKYSHTASPLPCGFDFNSSISQAASCRCPRFPRLSAIAINYPLSSQTVHIIRFTAHFQSMCVYHACKKKIKPLTSLIPYIPIFICFAFLSAFPRIIFAGS